ncbi:MAG: hypothetical protein JSS03_02760 [Proteobacteria bacterium]|nr:hypothetical protein [Pseudomonadota bacterium]
MRRNLRLLLATLACALLAACVPSPAARTTPQAAAPATAPTASATPSTAPTAHPPPTVADPVAGLPDYAHPDRRCTVDADCQVKNVGNCCGAFPMCVNKDAPVDAQAVKAQCAREHRFGMCHVVAVRGCSCVHGQCEDANAAPLSGRR